MKKILVLLLLVTPLTLLAKYKFDETFFIPIEYSDSWKKGKQTATEDGASLTRFIHNSEAGEMLTIQFKDRQLIQGATAEEAMAHEQKKSPLAQWKLIKHYPNDVVYERTFPGGEHELVRMIMTNKGLHRAAYLKHGTFDESERSKWLDRLMNGVVGH